MITREILQTKALTEAWVDLLVDSRPDFFASFVFNDAAWVDYDRGGGKPLSMYSAARWIERVAYVVDHKALGTSLKRHPEKRMGLIAFPEKPDVFLHYHGFIWLPDVTDAHRGGAFAWTWFEEAWTAAWKTHVPSGTIEMSRLEWYLDELATERAIRYSLKESWKGHSLPNMIISPVSGPLPRRMLRGR